MMSLLPTLLILAQKCPYRPTTRFAPSPTGYLHVGHVLSLLYTFAITEWLQGKVLLRIEDHDRQRCQPKYTTALLADLGWLGFLPANWSEIQTGHDLYWQSRSLRRYEGYLAKLADQGLLYHCSCSRQECLRRGLTPCINTGEIRYDGFCRMVQEKVFKKNNVRLITQEKAFSFWDLWQGECQQIPQQQCGDFLLVDRHGSPTYNFAVVCDDLDHGVDLIIRGADLLPCTGRQLLVAERLGRTKPLVFAHHPLVCDAEGRKLGKRFFSQSLAERRASGLTVAEVLGEALWLAGHQSSPLPLSRQKAIDLLLTNSSQVVAKSL